MYKPRFQPVVLAALACALLALPAAADSQARIVRLSDVQGGVQIDKNTGLGFESAFLNLPITQGTKLRTRERGRAEIEFEDGSTLRLTPNTTVVFSTLGLSDAGKRNSAVNLVDGRAYVNWLGKSGDSFSLEFSQEKVVLAQAAAHFRVATSPSLAEVASFKSDLDVVGPSATVEVPKKKMVAFDTENNGEATAAKSVQEDTYDDWDKQSVSYHDQYAKNNPTPLGYGTSDLSYYGSYSNLPGYGTLWQPYFAGVGWNPFMDGAWSFYPGMGMMWASAYPWGWMPYYYGNWLYAPGFGWGWQPGNFNAWHGGLHYVGAAAEFHAPVAPTGTVNTVIVGKGGPRPSASGTLRMVVSNGSAGLGIPRGSVSNLRQLHSQVAKAGSVELHPIPQFRRLLHAPVAIRTVWNAPGLVLAKLVMPVRPREAMPLAAEPRLQGIDKSEKHILKGRPVIGRRFFLCDQPFCAQPPLDQALRNTASTGYDAMMRLSRVEERFLWGKAMQEHTTEIAAVRAEIMKLLHQQLEALDSREGLSDTKLMECYDRQGRVQALREQLQTIGKTEELHQASRREPSNVVAMP